MKNVLEMAVPALLGASSLLLLVYGVNLLHLTRLALRTAREPSPPPVLGDEPPVCVQLPIYNERHVAARVIDAACALDWPARALEVQVLDDSDDGTRVVAAARVRHWRRRGVNVVHVTRTHRTGYKAGALAHGLALTRAGHLAVFDADFRPGPGFLREVMGAFAAPDVGFVQARWGHLNAGFSTFTRLQALMVDFHFRVEQFARPRHGYLMNFTGSAGVWRREAIEAAGGWDARTLTEDLDLSYRAQLAGWRGVYLDGVEVGQELPVDFNGYRGQQARWATGSFQTARLLLPAILRSSLGPAAKFQAVVHLLAYSAPLLMLLQLATYPGLLLLKTSDPGLFHAAQLPVVVNLLSVAPVLGLCAAQARAGRSWWRTLPAAVGWSFVGAGTSYTVLRAALRSFGRGGPFVRTPKYRIESSGQEWRGSEYVRPLDLGMVHESVLGLGAAALAGAAAVEGEWLLAAYASLFAGGLLLLGLGSALQGLQVITLRRLGEGALGTVSRLAPALVLLAGAATLLALFLRLPDPFEDSYQHWLIAASLASGAGLRDPIFSMQDSWLPGYHVVAAAVLRVFGTWRLDLLKAMNAAVALGVLAAVHELAPNRRQALVAVALLALNPVFLLVSTDAVAEPLLTLLLVMAAVAGVRGRAAWAALFCAAACLVGIKAWIWVAAMAAAALFPLLLGRRPRARTAWAPALAGATAIQFAFLPASHSLARGAQEAASAMARGSIPPGPAARVVELAGTLGLAALPMLAPAVAALFARRPGADRIRWLHAPALVYLVAVVVLVGAGGYSGSHRYLYPALPALALLAASMLDRAGVAATALSMLAAGALTIGFVPVFQAFAAENQGLRAAGLDSSTVPGRLLTDSPAVAYFSHKPPAEVAGSRALPADRDAALDWLRSRGYGAIVLEDVSYYPATSIFPDLVAGRPGPGFMPLGPAARYEVAGGKAATAYRVLPAAWDAPAGGGARLALEPAPSEGKTGPLAKGPYLVARGAGVAGEGMGFGVPIVEFADGWWYPGSSTTTDISTPGRPAWRRVFHLDVQGGDAVHGYRFVAAADRADIEVTYKLTGEGLEVAARPLRMSAGSVGVALLNEQSSAFDDFATAQVHVQGEGFGPWQPVTGDWARLRSASAGVEWSLQPVAGAALYAGRERADGLDWAGLDYLFGPGFSGTTYTIAIQEAR